MPIQKDGQTYYTMDETSQKLDESIERNAQELLQDLKKAHSDYEQQVEYV